MSTDTDHPASSASSNPSAPPPESPRRIRKRSLILAGLIVVVLLGGVWWLTHGAGASSADARKSRHAFWGANAAIPVVVQAAHKGDIDIYMNGLGTVTPLATVVVRTRISGQLTEVHFQEGQEVQAGDLLAVIDPRPYQVAMEQAQGQLQQARAQLAQAQSDYGRYLTLSHQDSIAQQQVDNQRALVNQYEGLVQSDEAAVNNAKLNLTYCHITAPLTGRVGLRQVDPGNYVTPGDSGGLVTLTQFRPISVIFTLPEEDYLRVFARQRSGATIPVDAYDSSETHKLASGTLSAIDNQADPSTGTFKLRASFPNENETLFPNAFVNVHMLLEVNRGAILTQSSAIEQGQLGTYVYVVGPDDTVTARAVTLGTAQGERVAVVKGLEVGDRVVVDGADRLKEGSHVVAQQAGGQPSTGAGHSAASAGSKGGKTLAEGGHLRS